MKDEIWKAYSHGMAVAMQEGGIYLPSLLLRSYSQLGLDNFEMMLMLHLISFAQTEQIEFPTPKQLADRMGTTAEQVEQSLGRLLKEQYITIEDYIDEESGRHTERYNWQPFFVLATQFIAEEQRHKKTNQKQPVVEVKPSSTNLFSTFEQEFGRLLSPMECETIINWLDNDQYTEEIILFALKEAVFAGKLSLRYIDRILIEWSRNRITNADEAKAHINRFRKGNG
ncbi:DnaD domain-containing protein [Paenibacillus yanchengensis]|uniref:DnaD domain-containing protein n=1 Tax=Paenibacillus yanchengensis TaxID=2035833 RepID=A0ABW4YJU3_9BACL